MRRYGSLPLVSQPGERWLYNGGSEILESVLNVFARVAGTTFGEFLSERIFTPLGMKDTAFFAPKDKAPSFRDSLYARFRGATVEGIRSSGHGPVFQSARV